MNILDRPHRVSVQTRTEVSDGHDGVTESWANVQRRIAAKVKPLQGKDLERAHQIDPRISHEVTLQYWQGYPADLDGGRARLVYHDLADRTFEIVGAPVDVDEQHVALMLNCKEQQ